MMFGGQVGRDSKGAGGGGATINKRWFQNLFADKQTNQRAIAKALGLHAPALTRVLNGERRLQMSEAIDLARALDVPLDDVLVNAGLEPAHSTGAITAEIRGVVNADSTVDAAKGRIKSVEAPAEGYTALTYGTLGWTMFYRPSSSVSPDAIGRLALVKSPREGSPRIAIVGRGSRPSVYDLTDPFTQDVVRDVPLTSASPIYWVKT